MQLLSDMESTTSLLVHKIKAGKNVLLKSLENFLETSFDFNIKNLVAAHFVVISRSI